MSNPSLEQRFQNFLKLFKADSKEKYRQRLSQMATSNAKSLVVDFDDLYSFDPEFAKELVANPDEYLDYCNRAVWAQMKIEDPEYAENVKNFIVRFRSLPERRTLRDIGSQHLGRLLSVDGIVIRAAQVKPYLVRASFQCRRCGATVMVEQKGLYMKGPTSCPRPGCRSKVMEFKDRESVYINSQELRVQERPEDLPAGQLPRSIDVRALEDLTDVARPGDRVNITGIIRAEQELVGRKGRLRTFNLYIDANYIEISGKEVESIEITPEDQQKIIEISKDPWIHRKLIMSLAPSIYGYDDMKEAILYLLFGGVPKRLPDGVNIRGDINILLVGDPGTAKSQLLQYVARVAPRGLYTSGRGTTAAGLTAAVLREKAGGMVLEAGALVLADRGVCSIDEIDKMRPDDRVAIHEAMEQQTISIAKGGIVATLNARNSIIAAANPALGRYDPYRNISENINLPVTILSRFDLIFVMRDIPESDMDNKMSTHILTLHRLRTTAEEAPLPPDLLRKYISYAKRIDVTLTEEASNELKDFYLKMRASSGLSPDSPIAITPRQLEALVRLSEARARAFLRDKVTLEDARAVIRLMTVSLQDVGIDTSTGKIDIDVIMTGKPRSLVDRIKDVLDLIAELEKEKGFVEESILYKTLGEKRSMSEEQARTIVNRLLREGIVYSPEDGKIKRTAGGAS
ncbi:MAG: minichromosome maintenance protein MCM [Candidatus Bathyarchaeia archaeon]